MGIAGLSFGVEKALKKIFGSGGIPPEAIELGKLADKLSPAQKKGIKSALTERGLAGYGHIGGFLGMLASLGIPLAIELVKKGFRKRNSSPTTKRKRNEIATSPNCWNLEK